MNGRIIYMTVRKLSIRSLLLIGAICLVAFAASDEDGTPDIANTRATLEQYVKTQRTIANEKRKLALKRQILNERIQLVQREIKSLRDKIDEAEESIAEADKKRQDMLKENEKLKEASASLETVLVSLEENTAQLLHRLPDPIRERVKPLSQRLPEDVEQTKLSVAERFQNIVGILNEMDKFNREVSVFSEVRSLPDGGSVEVAALYFGIGQGYYSGGNGTVAGIGTVADQWLWKPADQAAPQIADAIAIFKNEKVASFVQLPVEIQ